jgi:methionyl-tRNA formyltransferase
MEVERAGDVLLATGAAPGERLRVAILRSDDPHHLWLEASLARRLDVVGVVVEPGSAQQARLWRTRKLSAWCWRGYQVRRQRWTGRSAYKRRYFALDALGPLAAPPRVEVDWINSARAREAVRLFAPDVVVVCGTMYLDPAVTGGAVTINVHGGWLPRYRGNHGVFFAYERGDFERIAASLHLLTADLDGGDVLAIVRPEVLPHDNDEHLYCRAVEAAIERLVVLLEQLEGGGTIPCTPQGPGAETFRHRDRTPARELRLWAKRRLGRHPVPHLRPVSEPGGRPAASTARARSGPLR